MPRILRCWSGGSTPDPAHLISKGERQLVIGLFLEQVFVFFNFWHSFPDEETRELFWGRARFDAHATFRPLSDWETR